MPASSPSGRSPEPAESPRAGAVGASDAPMPALVLQSAARQIAGGQQYPAGALYVVATPIGNLADLTLRAVEVLVRADAIACEDTRVTAPLLRHLGLSKPLIVADEHHERAAAGTVVARLGRGERVALVSDAGTPALSDPGARVVDAARAAGHRVVPIPGASAAMTALSAAGQVGEGYRFAGFLPARGSARSQALRRLAESAEAVVLYEAPHRIEALADELSRQCGTRTVTVARELTKQFEQIETLPAGALPAWLHADAHRRRGEFVLVLHAAPGSAEPPHARLDAVLGDLLAEMSVRRAAAIASRWLGLPRDVAYARALQLRPAAPVAEPEDAAGSPSEVPDS